MKYAAGNQKSYGLTFDTNEQIYVMLFKGWKFFVVFHSIFTVKHQKKIPSL